MSSYYEKILATGEVKCIDDEIPFEIPLSWCWVRLGAIATIIGGYAFPSESIKSEKGYRVIRISDFNDSKIVYNKVVRYNGDADLTQYEICERDILMAMTGGTVGKSVFLTELPEKHMLLNQRVAIIRNKYIFDEYLNLVITSPITIDVVNSRKNSTNDNISMVDIYNFLVPVPSTNEQKKIVQKIQEALPFVYTYGKSQEALDKLNAEIFDKLRKSVLQEAIQGKLVPQSPDDEPASVLLERIKAEKAKLFKEGKLKKKDLVDPVIFKGDDNKYYERINKEVVEVELPCDYPDGWCVVRLKDVCQLIDGEKMNGKGICLDAKYLRGKSSPTYLDKGRFVRANDNIILVDGENSGEVFAVPVDGYMGSTFKQLWLSSAMYKPYLLAFILFYKEALRNSKRGAAIPHLNKELFYNLPIGIPPYQEQERIAQRIDALFQLLK